MSDLRDKVREALAANGVGPVGADLHSWRCGHPERYGDCTCVDELVDDVVAVVVQAARDAVAAQGIVTANLVRLDAALAAIDALKEDK